MSPLFYVSIYRHISVYLRYKIKFNEVFLLSFLQHFFLRISAKCSFSNLVSMVKPTLFLSIKVSVYQKRQIFHAK